MIVPPAVEGLDPEPIHVAMMVPDLEGAVAAWSRLLGKDPAVRHTTAPYSESRTEYKGAPTPARLKMALFDTGDFQIELGEPADLEEPSVWADHLNEGGPGLHHIGYRVVGMSRVVAALEDLGFPLVQQAEFEGGRYAYIDSAPSLGAMIELLEFDNHQGVDTI
jgi:catechol 2,3-dioxygenase-like lactoylglutathione lyase family enzyme